MPKMSPEVGKLMPINRCKDCAWYSSLYESAENVCLLLYYHPVPVNKIYQHCPLPNMTPKTADMIHRRTELARDRLRKERYRARR